MFHSSRIRRTVILMLPLISTAILILAQAPGAGPVLRLTATSANLASNPAQVRIDVLSWSAQADRDRLLAAWNLTPAPAGGRGGAARGGRGAPQQEAPGAAPGGAARGAAGAARGAGGARGAAPPRGGAPGGGPPAATASTPEAALAAALQASPTIGYVWTPESIGYAIRYAARISEAGGTERIILATDRRLGTTGDFWRPASAAVSEYEFSIIELRLNNNGRGEGKTSLTGKIALDAATGFPGLADYTTLPVMLQDVRIAAGTAGLSSTVIP